MVYRSKLNVQRLVNLNKKVVSGETGRPVKKPVVEGCRIIDLEYLIIQLQKGCAKCSSKLDICDIEKEYLEGYASILSICCSSCGRLNEVYTSRHQQKIIKNNFVYEVKHFLEI